MKIILSPTKKMKDDFILDYDAMPHFLAEAEEILMYLKGLSYLKLKKLYKASDSITNENFENLKDMDLNVLLTPALYAYKGIAFTYLSPDSLSEDELSYLESHLRILSALYGVLKPMDGIRPYRLEMQAQANVNGTLNLYEYWGRLLHDEVMDETHIVINLASEEYFKCITDYEASSDKIINIRFVEEYKGHLVTKATFAKMARGAMVRFMALNKIEDPKGLKNFTELGYSYRNDLSSETEYVFERMA